MSTTATNGTATDNGKVGNDQRYTSGKPCPICRGHERLPRGNGERCTGYFARGGKSAFCSRVDSGDAIESDAGPIYRHRLKGDCSCGTQHAPPDPGSNGKAKGKRTLDDAIRSLREYHGAVEAVPYVYHDADGRKVGATVRLNFAEGGKDYRPISRTTAGLWQTKGIPEPRPLYRLPEVLAAESVIVAEGEKAAQALLDLGVMATTAPQGAQAPAKADWSPLAGKTVAIWPDNDKPGEQYAAKIVKLLEVLRPQPTIKVLRPEGLPPKADAVEWIEAGGTKGDLLRLIREASPLGLNRVVPIDESGWYVEQDSVLTLVTEGQEGQERRALTNFTARITHEVDRHEGGAVRKQYRIAARTIDGRAAEAIVEAEEYRGARWVDTQLGGAFTLHAGTRFGEHLTTAVKLFSIEDGIRRETVHTSTGWVRHGDRWLYLHGGGAIGADGPTDAVRVDLSSALAPYHLPDPPTDPGRIKRAVGACLGLMRLAKADRPGSRGAAAIVATVPWRAVLGPFNAMLQFSGTTGTRKTTLARLAQQHFSTTLKGRDCPMPVSWRATANSLQRYAHDARDALLVIDELTGAQAVETATEFAQSQGNLKGRDRMRRDGSMAPSLDPRGSVLSTGEADPDRQSALGRMLTVKFTPATVHLPALTECQADADAGLYAEAMAAFLRWLAPRLDDVKAAHRARVEELAEDYARQVKGLDVHPRHPRIVAELAAAYGVFLDFAREAGVLGEEGEWWQYERVDEYIIEDLKEQADDQTDRNTGRRFLDSIAAALASGRFHLTDSDTNDVPHPYAVACGWHEELKYQGSDEGQQPYWVPPANSGAIGRIDVDEGFAYLVPENAKAAARDWSRRQGSEIENLQQIGRELAAAKLCETEQVSGRTFNEVRRKFPEMGRRRYFKIPIRTLLGDIDDE